VRESFRAVELERMPSFGHTFDLAACLEVAEPLPHRRSDQLLARLTEAAPAVLFSAAIPGQGGVLHLNEQWPEYWRRRFQDRGYVRLDPFRRRIWQNPDVAWRYQPNPHLYVRSELIARSAELREEQRLAENNRLELVAETLTHKLMPIRSLLPTVHRAFWRGVHERVLRK
jgi:hypothetical protein